MASGRLGTARLTANTDTVVYTVPAGTVSTVNIGVLNQGGNAALVKIALSTTDVPAAGDYVEASPVPAGGGVLERFGIMAGAGERVVAADKVHLTGKPLPLLVDLLGIAPEGGTVLDPFTGGGTTPLACIETRRRFIGVELSGEYFELAGARIKQADKAAKQED